MRWVASALTAPPEKQKLIRTQIHNLLNRPDAPMPFGALKLYPLLRSVGITQHSAKLCFSPIQHVAC